jgi:UDP-N-acetylmuramate dehydrogenase
MVQTQQNINLKTYHTFGFESVAQQFTEVRSMDDIRQLIEKGVFEAPFYLLGGGSNTLFMEVVESHVVCPIFKGIDIVERTSDHVCVDVGASVVWDDFVAYCVNNGFGGVENLSLIPGHVGASPVQNIGAYGVEACDAIEHVEALDLRDGHVIHLTNADCRFGYRDSIFKHELRGMALVTSVRFKLSLQPHFRLDYGHLADAVKSRGAVTLQSIRETIIDIRQAKLPDPVEVGNAGSFFKNPVVDAAMASVIRQRYDKMPEYASADGVKIPAGWLIEQCGWKGRSLGNAGVHDKQALVLVNKGQATCSEVLALAAAIEQDVRSMFGIQLEKEVIVVG